MATFEERAERLKKELEKAANGNQRRNLSREYELTLRRGTRSSASHTSEARATQVLSSKGPAATGPLHDSLRYPLLLIFPPDRVEVPGNARHVHREAQDFKKQVHRLHSNQRSERCPQADSAAVKILPHRPRWGMSDPFLEWCRSNGQSSL